MCMCIIISIPRTAQGNASLKLIGGTLGDLREKSFKIALWPKGFFVQPAKTGTVNNLGTVSCNVFSIK